MEGKEGRKGRDRREGREGRGGRDGMEGRVNWMPVLVPRAILVYGTVRVPVMGAQSCCPLTVWVQVFGALGRKEMKGMLRWEKREGTGCRSWRPGLAASLVPKTVRAHQGIDGRERRE